MEFDANKLPENPKTRANFLSVLFFWWTLPFFRAGHKKDLEVNDLYKALPEDQSRELGKRLHREWDKELEVSNSSSSPQEKPSLLKALLRTFGWKYALLGLFAMLEECFLRTVQPVCLGRLLRYFSPDSQMEPWEAYFYALCVVLGSAFSALMYHLFFFGVQYVGMKLRIACCTLVYRKCLKLSKSALRQTTIGQMVNLLSNDVTRFDQSVIFLHYLWVGPVQMLISLGILWSELGPSCLVGLAVLILFIPFQGWLGNVFSRLRLETAKRTDERIRVMNEIISGIRVIKMYTWEKPFAELINYLRCKEVDVIRKTSYFKALNMTLFFVSSKLIVFLTFLTYVLTGNLLTSEKVFVTIALYSNVRLIMTLFFPYGVTQAAETRVSIKRLQDFLLLDENQSSQATERLQLSQCGVWLNNFTSKWSATCEDNALKSVTCHVRPGQLLAIIGPVGSGKSSLLHAVLGELITVSGEVQTVGKVAYASQEPWVFSGTVQENILCGQHYNPPKYKKIVKVCALEKDLTLLPYGDQTYVGERGVSLSGGQKARVNLARALYLDADIYLLDDPLSAVDTHVGHHLFEKSILSFLRNKIRILVTHQLQYLKYASYIVILKDGCVETKGTFDDLVKSGVDFAKLLKKEDQKEVEEELNDDFDRKSGRSTSLTEIELEVLNFCGSPRIRNTTNLARSSTKTSRESVEIAANTRRNEEQRSTDVVSRQIYRDYFLAGGGLFLTFLLVVTNILAQVIYSASDFWLTLWTNMEETQGLIIHVNGSNAANPSTSYELTSNDGVQVEKWWDSLNRLSMIYIYTGLIIVLFIFAMSRTALFFTICMKSSVNMHKIMFQSVIRTPVSFFDTNPVGRTLNRFSKDIGTMDEMLPTTFFDFIEISLTIAGIVVVVAVVNPWLLLPVVLLGIVFHFLRSFYLDTARDVKRLEGITRSPVFSHLSTSLIGLTTIRAHQIEETFQRNFDNYQDVHSSAWYMFLATSRWFCICLDWISVTYIASVTFACVALNGTINGSLAGLVISSAIMLTGAFQWGVRQSAETENQMTSVERVLEYTKLSSEQALDSTEEKKPPENWPAYGEVNFRNVHLTYSADAPPVVKDITCTIYPKEKIGIVGRTGAGKSSLIAALFRLTEPEGVIQIDGIDTKEIGLHDLRSRIAIIPQDPVLFTGTLRYNLDPFCKFTDQELWKVIEEVKLKETVSDLSTGLDTEVAEGGSNFSVGQRQLICLARAILRQNRILVLDEATANVDPKTDSLIQETIRKKFSDCTVLTIAHRLNTIMDSTRIMVLDSGYLREFDKPLTLLSNTSTLFHSLVDQTGRKNAEILRALAEEAAEETSSL